MQKQFKWGNYSRTGTIWGNILISLTDNTVSHFQCGVHQCHSKWYRPDGFCPWWWFGSYQKSKPMYTCSTGKFSQYFEDHHFKLKLNRNAGWYRRLICGYRDIHDLSYSLHWLLLVYFVQKAFVFELFLNCKFLQAFGDEVLLPLRIGQFLFVD